MKKIIHKLLLLSTAVFIFSGCEGDRVVDQVFDDITRGAVLRTLEETGTNFNLFDTSSTFSVTAEVESNGVAIDRVDIFVSFNDNFTDDMVDNSAAEVPFGTIDGSEFTVGPNGFPSTSFSYTFGEGLTALGLDVTQVNGNDQFVVRFELTLADGRVFSDNNLNSTVSGGSFFRSPFRYAQTMVCLFDAPDFFTGDYMLEQISGSDPFFGEMSWGTGQTVTLVADGTIRRFDLVYFPGRFDSDYGVELNFVCDRIFVTNTINAGGLGCGGANIGSMTGTTFVNFFDQDLMDDDTIDLSISDFNPDGNCDTGPNEIVVRLTRI